MGNDVAQHTHPVSHRLFRIGKQVDFLPITERQAEGARDVVRVVGMGGRGPTLVHRDCLDEIDACGGAFRDFVVAYLSLIHI